MDNYIFIVEGAHDVALLGSVLKLLKFKNIKNINQLGEVFKNLIPTSFPFDEESLNIFNIVPSFYKKDNKFVCIINANGETNLIPKLDSSLDKIGLNNCKYLTKVIIFCDADTEYRETKIQGLINNSFSEDDEFRFKKECLKEDRILLEDFNIEIPFSFYVFPDNENTGRIEEILIEVIEREDKELLEKTDEFLDSIPDKYKDKWRDENSQLDKTRISCVGNVKKPAASMGAIIEKSKWIKKDTVENCKYLNGIYMYLKNELEV